MAAWQRRRRWLYLSDAFRSNGICHGSIFVYCARLHEWSATDDVTNTQRFLLLLICRPLKPLYGVGRSECLHPIFWMMYSSLTRHRTSSTWHASLFKRQITPNQDVLLHMIRRCTMVIKQHPQKENLSITLRKPWTLLRPCSWNGETQLPYCGLYGDGTTVPHPRRRL